MKKMKRIFFAAVAATVAMTSCSIDNVVDQPTSGQISFNVLSSRMTRATPVTPSNITTAAPDFVVFGFKNTGGSQYVGTDASNGVKIQYADTKWDYANSSDLAYWPSEALNFYAVNPSSNDNVTINITNDSQKLDYQMPANNAQQIDLMYASKLNLTKPGDYTVHFIFKHALSQIVFKAKTASTDLLVNVEGLTVNNLNDKGGFTFPSVETASGSAAGTWSVSSSVTPVATDVALGLASSNVTVNNTSASVNLTAADGALLVIPQTPVKWATTSSVPVTISTANDNGQCYLSIQCKIQYKGTYLVGSSTDAATIYVPFGEQWDPGKKYIYTLIFGGGYDEGGESELQPILYDVDVEDWIDDTPEDIVM